MGTMRELTEKKMGFLVIEEIAHCHRWETMQCIKTGCVTNLGGGSKNYFAAHCKSEPWQRLGEFYAVRSSSEKTGHCFLRVPQSQQLVSDVQWNPSTVQWRSHSGRVRVKVTILFQRTWGLNSSSRAISESLHCQHPGVELGTGCLVTVGFPELNSILREFCCKE